MIDRPCAELGDEVVLVAGVGGQAREVVGRMATALADADPPLVLVHLDEAGPCAGVDALLGDTRPVGHASEWTGGDRAICQLVGLATGLPADAFVGTDAGSGTAQALAAVPDPAAGLAFLTTDAAEAARDTVRPLAWQAAGQHRAVWPDSGPAQRDKANVRRGAYDPWAALTFACLGGATCPDAVAERVLAYVASGASARAAAEARAIPPCAMHVARLPEHGAMWAAEPAAPCDCLFDAIAGDGPTCAACDVTTCASGTCRDGWCEAR